MSTTINKLKFFNYMITITERYKIELTIQYTYGVYERYIFNKKPVIIACWKKLFLFFLKFTILIVYVSIRVD